MPETIDVTGLPEPILRDIRRLVETLRQSYGSPNSDTDTQQSDREAWIARWRAFAATRTSSNPNFDDSRESIYEGRGE
jgi:hypothetical protein